MNELFFRKLRKERLPNDARARIMAACRAEAAHTKRTPRRTAMLLIAAAVITAATLTVGAIGSATEWFGLRGRAESHFADDPDIVITQPDAVATVDDGGLAPIVLSCDAVTGGGNQLYLGLTLKRTDGSNVLAVEDGETLLYIDFPGAVLTLPDGTQRKVYISPLGDSTPDCIRLEGSVLLYNADLVHIGQPATFEPGEMVLTVQTADGACHIRALGTPARSMTVSLSYRNDTLDRDIAPITVLREGVTVSMTHISMTNAELILSGSCDAAEGTEMPWLGTLLDQASLTLADGTVIPCGTKNGCGTMPDGSFILNWILDKAIDTSKVVALTLDGQTVDLH